jgi:hypothetical protein
MEFDQTSSIQERIAHQEQESIFKSCGASFSIFNRKVFELFELTKPYFMPHQVDFQHQFEEHP